MFCNPPSFICFMISSWDFISYYTTENLLRFGGKEWNKTFSDYDFSARYFSTDYARFTTQDPLAEKTPNLSPYAYCAGNPMRFVDPTGKSTWVYKNEDATYTVFGGDLEDEDYNIYVYTKDEEGQYTNRGESIGLTTSISSFYNYDKNKWEEATIDMNNVKGKEFLQFVVYADLPLVVYAAHALPGGILDFKATDGSFAIKYKGKDQYRGMPIGTTKSGQVIISSARDIGNIAAGYEAGSHRLSWNTTRLFFDGLQKIQDKNIESRESISSVNAQKYGWEIGYRKFYNSNYK